MALRIRQRHRLNESYGLVLHALQTSATCSASQTIGLVQVAFCRAVWAFNWNQDDLLAINSQSHGAQRPVDVVV
jgi:hypothetical protein